MDRECGFTLMEMLITTSLVAILAAMAIPPLADFTARQRLVTATNQFVGHLMFSRTHAVTKRRRTTMCPGHTTHGCLPQPDWELGWIVFEDINGSRDLDPHERVLRVQGPLRGIRVRSSRYRKRITYQPTGTSGGSNASFSFCSPRPSVQPLKVILSNGGRARQAHPKDRPADCGQGSG